MAKADSYSLTEIKVYWNQYWNKTGFRYMIQGKWIYNFSNNPIIGLIDATKAEHIFLRNRITFPEFLEKYGKNDS